MNGIYAHAHCQGTKIVSHGPFTVVWLIRRCLFSSITTFDLLFNVQVVEDVLNVTFLFLSRINGFWLFYLCTSLFYIFSIRYFYIFVFVFDFFGSYSYLCLIWNFIFHKTQTNIQVFSYTRMSNEVQSKRSHNEHRPAKNDFFLFPWVDFRPKNFYWSNCQITNRF